MQLPPPSDVQRIAVLGAGSIGASWAALFVALGKQVSVFDPDPSAEQRVEQFISRAQPVLVQLGIAKPDASAKSFRFHSAPADAVRDTQFVQESGPENLAAKRSLFQQIGSVLPPDAIIASSTSGLLISEIQQGLPMQQRLLVGHPFNPPHLMPLVEVLAGEATDPAVTEWAMDFYRAIGKHPIRINREVPGHVANRLQAALWREAVHLVVEGVASAADVDAAVAYGPGLRWAIMGPHMIFHLGGGQHGIRGFLDHLGPSFDAWWQDLGAPRLTEEVKQKLVESVAQEAQGQSMDQLMRLRDQQLTALLNALTHSRKSVHE